jgi:hypothetical protein
MVFPVRAAKSPARFEVKSPYILSVNRSSSPGDILPSPSQQLKLIVSSPCHLGPRYLVENFECQSDFSSTNCFAGDEDIRCILLLATRVASWAWSQAL